MMDKSSKKNYFQFLKMLYLLINMLTTSDQICLNFYVTKLWAGFRWHGS